MLVFGLYDGAPDGKELTEKVTPYGLVLLSNPIRKDAWETFQYFADQGVDIKVISGDNPVTVSRVASEAGISRAENYVDATTLKTQEGYRSGRAELYCFRPGNSQPETAVCPLPESSG